VGLAGADLGACAKAAAKALDLKSDEVMVTDAMGDTLTLDVLAPTIRAEQVVARKEALLEALKDVPGIEILKNSDVHSDGVLGLISLDKGTGQEVIQRSRKMAAEISEHIQKRALVCSTGREVLRGQIRDTNTPFLMEALRDEGYEVRKGPILDDDADLMERAFLETAGDGYGLLITTGGIGAEGKDQTLEALARVDSNATMPYILKFHKGQGRHHREGVRIGVGVVDPLLIICLPGPHDEVRLAWPVLRKGFSEAWDKVALAQAIADALREKFLSRSNFHGS
jgi:molybdenum cofactor synthesis domain-containing protein